MSFEEIPFNMPGHDSSQLVGKKKMVTDSYIHVLRDHSGGNPYHLDPSIDAQYLGCSFLCSALKDQNSSANTFAKPDIVRVAVGKHWDYHPTVAQDDIWAETWFLPSPGAPSKFENNWAPVKTFLGKSLYLDYCNPSELYTYPIQGSLLHRLGVILEKRTLLLRTNPLEGPLTVDTTDDPENWPAGASDDGTFWMTTNEAYKRWVCLMKTGVTDETGEQLLPIVDTRRDDWFYDHFHEAQSPFTPTELLTKQPVGKAYYANYKTYYNERTRNFIYENFIGNKYKLRGSLPNIYAFISLVGNKKLADFNFMDLSNIIGPNTSEAPGIYINKYIPRGGNRSLWPQAPAVYSELLKTYPLETSITLYGKIGLYGSNPKIIENIVTLNYEKTDATALFNQYLQQWVLAYREDRQLVYFDVKSVRTNYYRVMKTLIGSLERIGSNIIFSPEFIPLMKKADKYKNYFPMHIELEFTAETLTNLGDFIKKTFMTKFFANLIAAKGRLPKDVALNHPWDNTSYSNRLYVHGTGVGNPGSDPDNYLDAIQPLPINSSVQETGLQWTTIAPYEDTITVSEWKQNYTTNLPCGKKGAWSSNSDAQGNRMRCWGSGNNLHWRGAYINVNKKITKDPGISAAKLGMAGPQGVKDMPPAFSLAGSLDVLELVDAWAKGNTWDQNNAQHELAKNPQAVTLNRGQFFDVRGASTFIGNSDGDKINLDSEENSLWKSLIGPALLAKIANIYNLKRRSYEDILNGVPAYTEDLFYRIEKMERRPGQEGWEIIQNIIIPNTSELDIVKYVDTQVKYATHASYKYVVYAERIVFGSKYMYWWGDDYGYEGEHTIDTVIYQGLTAEEAGYNDTWYQETFFRGTSMGSKEASLEVSSTAVNLSLTASPEVRVHPSIRLIEDKIFETGEIIILDRPPVAPYVDVLPYRAVNNRIKIILAGSTDRYRDEPVYILDSDADSFARILSAQTILDGKVEFGSDDPIDSFQIFRIQTKPKSYSDFTLHPSKPTIIGGSGALEDNILPNTKYYYTFRAVDSHGHLSNPTPVYEVELIDEKGAVKPLIRVISMDPPDAKASTRECKKYIYIKPALKQLFFANNPDVDPIYSFVDEDKRKKYKMRLTSKGSGKKIDINFSFHAKITESGEE